ncbi:MULTISPECIES: DUF3288 family protein [Prochlorococcus]|uniref:DUF3288 family protein n=1 Tax=Prochlorococcus TaxID=1218 RepID=UPI000533B096|nr:MULTISPECIES: DUF3288 family protein [Prochlorococcus]KGG12645.1 hypothetical protein EV05_1858 [Prochlorococcus sp. MIT 0601]
MKDQNHPLYSIDRELVDRLLSKLSPTDEDLVDLARLFSRYSDFPGAETLQKDMTKTLKLWGMDRDQLNSKTREIWAKGYRPGKNIDNTVGSGFDTSEKSEP